MEAAFFTGIILILLFSVVLHEVMHGVAALYYGDRTAQVAGRLTLNPIPHIDPIGTVLLPLLLVISGSRVLFGWAKPVPVNPLNFSNIRQGEFVVSMAGIAVNFTIALAGALIFHLIQGFIPEILLTQPLLISLLKFAVHINLILGFFNLLPIPPLDGSKVLMALLPPHLASQFAQLEKYGIFILIFLWFVPFGQTSLLGAILGSILGLSRSLLGI